jgi:thiamine-phosphate pyrophosphorylase
MGKESLKGLSPARLWLVTDRRATAGRPLIPVVEACLGAGLRAVQLREKDLPARDLLRLATELRELTARHQARFVVNDRLDVALAVAADGVHLPAAGLPPAVARALVGPERLVGASTHSAAEAEAAAAEGADLVFFGPIYDTPSKRSFGPPRGLAELAVACRTSRRPVVAIGGVTPARVEEVRQAGAAGVAVIRALLEAEDPATATKALLAACERAWP